ncbi:MAG TPA: 3'(2'),5'-bisphosphate nucleotidase CysQ [Cytophagales bacterium]|nr:3'(2'),5'-bisphosphate nucleotidase CysQ [Cytophagales bacterium]
MTDSIHSYLEVALQAALDAGKAILEIYTAHYIAVELKEDKSPLTLADKAAHSIIVNYLKNTPFPVLSEEGKDVPFKDREKWDLFWMVDPLDGTKEFINRNGEFTVNIALINKQESILGVVYCPVTDKMYWGTKGKGSYVTEKGGVRTILKTSKKSEQEAGIRVLGSRHHLDTRTFEYIKILNQPEFLSMGSSLKFMAIAEDKADIYPRFAPTMEWDTAAAQIILEEAGGSVISVETNKKLNYNKPSLLNTFFIAKG